MKFLNLHAQELAKATLAQRQVNTATLLMTAPSLLDFTTSLTLWHQKSDHSQIHSFIGIKSKRYIVQANQAKPIAKQGENLRELNTQPPSKRRVY